MDVNAMDVSFDGVNVAIESDGGDMVKVSSGEAH